jgi:hypothetical protein
MTLVILRTGIGGMMQAYEELEVEVIEFECDDMIVTSNQSCTPISSEGGHENTQAPDDE